ncbi:MAG: M28 family peptidase [Planctomycetota bacterium]
MKTTITRAAAIVALAGLGLGIAGVGALGGGKKTAANETTATTAATTTTTAAMTARSIAGSPIADVLTSMSEDVLRYNDHITILASPFMEGRVPGSEGMERARHYVQYHFEKAGLLPPFPGEGGDFSSYRDPFELGSQWVVENEMISTSEGVELLPERDFVFTRLGAEGEVSGRPVFVGYGIEDGPDGFDSFGNVDVEGKIAVVLRFEPMDADGNSKFTGEPAGSEAASFQNKLMTLKEKGAAGAIFLTPPTVDEDRQRIQRYSGRGRRGRVQVDSPIDFPVFLASPLGSQRLLSGLGVRSMQRLIDQADNGRGAQAMTSRVTISGSANDEPLIAENVGGMIPGTGSLKDEWIVVGAHLDHLGMGYFGSRSGPGALHPGADDNASGSAGVVLLAEKLAEAIAARDDASRRSVLVVAFDGEESGINGSRHYADDPIVEMDDHVLMLNWDMIGRLSNDTLMISGTSTGKGFLDFIEPLFDGSGLNVVTRDRYLGGSDHLPFFRKEIPAVMGSIDALHADYHTPGDTSDKINRVAATKTVLLFRDIVLKAAATSATWEFQTPQSARGQSNQPQIRVSIGINLSQDDEDGVLLAGVTEGGAAAKAGLKEGDRIVRWDGVKLTDLNSFIQRLAGQKPGDEVNIGVKRDGEEMTMKIKLEAP